MLRKSYLGVPIALLVAGLLVGVVAYGCWSWSPTGKGNAAGGVAVVDLDAVARQLGVDLAIQKQINDTQTSLDGQLRSLQASLSKEYEEKSRELPLRKDGNASSPGDPAALKRLAELERNLNLQLSQAQQTARNKFGAYRSSLCQNFRDEVVPVARTIAGQQGMGIVLTKNDAVLLAFDRAHDITNAVVAELRKNRPTTSGQPAPAVARAQRSSADCR